MQYTAAITNIFEGMAFLPIAYGGSHIVLSTDISRQLKSFLEELNIFLLVFCVWRYYLAASLQLLVMRRVIHIVSLNTDTSYSNGNFNCNLHI